jgi:diguanylate cyclase (GGDEF)-like protein
MTTQPLTVLVVSDDRPTIQGLSRFLRAFGYGVDEAHDTDQALSALSSRSPDFIVIDGTDTTSCRLEILGDVQERCGEVYTFLMTQAQGIRQLREALESGVDDFLAKPVVFGELLARLRAGARALEHRRRAKAQCRTDRVTGLPSLAAFGKTIQTALHRADEQAPSVVCIAFELDYFGRFARQHGETFARQGLKAIAEHLVNHLQGSESLACGEPTQFFAALTGATEAEGAQWAEGVRAALAAESFPVGEITVDVTASFGVADNHGAEIDYQELLQRAQEAQKLARESGRNCVALYSQLHEPARSWASLASPGKLFQTTLARDVMIPCTVVVRRDEAIEQAKSYILKPSLTAIPVVDGVGTYVGYVTEKAIAEATEEQDRVRDLPIADAPCVDEMTTFANLIDFFTQDPSSLVFIVGNGHPVGFVTRSSLTALSDPVDKSTFCVDLPHVATGQHLSVCDTSFCCEP